MRSAFAPIAHARVTPKPTSRLRKPLKKTLPEALERIQNQHPDASVEVWAEDEHRIGLKPILRRVWCKKGQRPIVTVQHRYKWAYLYGFVSPQSGETFWLVLPRVNLEVWNVVLAEFAAAVGASANKRVVLVIDQAGWHSSKQVQLPEGIDVVFLPAYSPELQPAERLWSLSNEALVNKHFADLEELIEAQAERCRQLSENPETIRAHTQFHWWPETSIL